MKIRSYKISIIEHNYLINCKLSLQLHAKNTVNKSKCKLLSDTQL